MIIMSMRNTINIIHKAVLTVLAAIVTVGCVSEKDEISVDTNDVMVLLNISAGDMQTKAIDEDAIKTVRVFAFDQAGNLVGHLYSPTAGSDVHLILSVPEGQTTMTVDFYAVANEGAMYYDDAAINLSDNMTIDELNTIVYSSLITTENALPLYGKVSKTLALTSGSQHTVDGHTGFMLNESVSISLERSLAKIGVYAAAVSGASTNPVIHSITFKSQGRRNLSYLFPAVDNAELQARDATIASLSADRVFNLISSGTDMLSNGGVVSKRLDAQNTDKSVNVTDYYTEILSPFYLAEVPYGSSDWSVSADVSGRPVVLVVEYSFGEGTIKKYAEVNMPPIERNNFYQVRCLVKADGQILVAVSVNPWEAGEDWDIDFAFPTHSNPLFASNTMQSDGTYPLQYGKEATMYFSGSESDPGEEGAFSIDFNMSYPMGGRWIPAINHASNEDFKVLVYERGTTTTVSVPVNVKSDNDDTWYTIKVVPLKSGNVGKKATLSVSYMTLFGGLDYSYLLQINGGEENNLAWVEKDPSDTDVYEDSTVDIVITQVNTPI